MGRRDEAPAGRHHELAMDELVMEDRRWTGRGTATISKSEGSALSAVA